MAEPKLVVILGPTASGKSDLGLRVAKKYDGEIICADSRTIYRGMDVGTAKPQRDQMLQIPHQLIDIVEPNQSFSAAEFKQLALQKIAEITARGRLPIMVGGSGLYIDSVVFDYQFPAGADNDLRSKLNQLSNQELLARLEQADPEAYEAVDLKNRRRVIRAIETAGLPKDKSKQLRPNTLVLGLAPDKEIMRRRIETRAEKMLNEGLLDEVKRLSNKYGWDCEALTATGYRGLKEMIEANASRDEIKAKLVTMTLQLARGQITWFKRNQEITWLKDPTPAFELVRTLSQSNS